MKYVFRIAVVVAVVMAAWAILEPEVTNFVFQDELRDSAAQLGWRTGVTSVLSDEDLRNSVIRKAAKHDIELKPEQVTVQHSGTGEYTYWYIAVDYAVPVDLLVYSFKLHFNPTSKGGKFGGIMGSEPASLPSPAKVVPKPSQQKADQPRDPQKAPELKKSRRVSSDRNSLRNRGDAARISQRDGEAHRGVTGQAPSLHGDWDALHDFSQHLFGLLRLFQSGSVERTHDYTVGEDGDD